MQSPFPLSGSTFLAFGGKHYFEVHSISNCCLVFSNASYYVAYVELRT